MSRSAEAARFDAVRLRPGEDLRQALEARFARSGAAAGAVIACAGSLTRAVLRYADRDEGTEVPGPLEIVSLSGTLSPDGPHLHLAVSDRDGAMRGGHLLAGCEVRTTAEVVLWLGGDMVFAREPDEVTGARELVVTRPG
ncbi:PPC domain-containing DNA-binding protein [Histidinibacterium lentulum]|uniref:PPC domain-containing DNA-binding protein n=1 Tax=Histidinibacterium lentulum TaxID=2480588 RepID=UPI001FE92E80|nr:DUF296 domain-containing protein [Histidinibacterium lentulum]